jgi:hypothetical protein
MLRSGRAAGRSVNGNSLSTDVADDRQDAETDAPAAVVGRSSLRLG